MHTQKWQIGFWYRVDERSHEIPSTGHQLEVFPPKGDDVGVLFVACRDRQPVAVEAGTYHDPVEGQLAVVQLGPHHVACSTGVERSDLRPQEDRSSGLHNVIGHRLGNLAEVHDSGGR